MKLRAFFELIRLPATLTSPADSLAGLSLALFLSSQLILTPIILLKIISISALIYGAGMISNDIFDLKLDMETRSHRPLPAGKVSVLLAWSWAIGMQMLALSIALSISEISFDFSLATIILTYLYNGLLKDIRGIGPILMGFCRMGNFMIGASLAIHSYSPYLLPHPFYSPWLISAQSAFYVFALTMLSKFETEEDVGKVLSLKTAIAFMLIGSAFPLVNTIGRMTWQIWAFLSALFPITWLFFQFKGLFQKNSASPLEVRGYVMAGIRNIVLINFATAMAMNQWMISSILLLLFLLSFKAGKWFYGT